MSRSRYAWLGLGSLQLAGVWVVLNGTLPGPVKALAAVAFLLTSIKNMWLFRAGVPASDP